MPEITDAQYREYQAYSALGTPEDVGKKVRDLEKVKSESAERRQKLADADKRIAELEGKVPEGAVVLTGDDAQAHKAITDAGMTLKQVQDGLKERDELKADKTRRDREDAVRSAAKAENLDPDKAVKAFANLAGADALGFEAGEVAVQGKSEKQPAGYVVIDGKKTRLGEWLAAEHPYLNLAASGQQNNGNGGGVRETPNQRGYTPTPGTAKTPEDFEKATRSTADYTL